MLLHNGYVYLCGMRAENKAIVLEINRANQSFQISSEDKKDFRLTE